MMRLSTMGKYLASDPTALAEQILANWGYDPGSIKFFRASANFIFVFRKDGEVYFLRFNDASERELGAIEAEINLLTYLQEQSMRVARPLKSFHDRYIEVVDTEFGRVYAVVFAQLKGAQYEYEELDQPLFSVWGSALGKLHQTLKMMPAEYRQGRTDWRANLDLVQQSLPREEEAAHKELAQVRCWAEGLPINDENYGLIHYDFESDNLCWSEEGIGVLDFDDCANYWYVADIAYALRDLFKETDDLEHPLFKEFMAGYTQETSVDPALLADVFWFMRMHNLVTFTRLLRAIDISESPEYPEWLLHVRGKLVGHNARYRVLFEKYTNERFHADLT